VCVCVCVCVCVKDEMAGTSYSATMVLVLAMREDMSQLDDDKLLYHNMPSSAAENFLLPSLPEYFDYTTHT